MSDDPELPIIADPEHRCCGRRVPSGWLLPLAGVIGALVAVALFAWGTGLWPNSASHAEPAPVMAKPTEDERMTREIVGKWTTTRDHGPRELEIRADGTALMEAKFESGFLKFILGTQMTIDIEWHIAGGLLHFDMVGGKPESSVNWLKKTHGQQIAYPILELSETRLLVKDGGDDPDHDWKRVVE